MRLYLINPGNPLVSMAKRSYFRRYRIWKPLGLMTVAALTPAEWEVTILDENLKTPDYARLPKPDLVGLTAFTAQAPRAYNVAAHYRARGVPVVMGGIHASMCPEEALHHVDAIVKGEAEAVWPTVLADVVRGSLKQRYDGGFPDITLCPPARHDLLPTGYAFGSIQTTRGCPLNCHFCSVSAFNGHRYRHRSIEAIIDEFRQIPEKLVLIVDDNLIGTRAEHIAHAKDLFRAMIAAKLKKRWICQATINLADDAELLRLARKAGCFGVFIGFESPSKEGLTELGKKYNILKGGDLPASVGRIHRHGISVVGAFIMGLDCDQPGIGRLIAETAHRSGVDMLNILFLTPLPGTRLWTQMNSQQRIAADQFPEDWGYFTLGYPVANHRHFTWGQLCGEMDVCWRRFYSIGRILRRVWTSLRQRRMPLAMLIGNVSYRRIHQIDGRVLDQLDMSRGPAWEGRSEGESAKASLSLAETV